MNILRALIVMLFISTSSNVALAGQDDDKKKDGAQGTVSEPDCDNASVPVYL